MLDCFACKKGVADDMELHYRFLERLVERLGMDKMSAPTVIHAPTKNGEELYPSLAGVSAWVPLIQSGIQMHSIEPSHEIYIDVFSCKEFDPNVVLEFARENFEFQMYQPHFLIRGQEHTKFVAPGVPYRFAYPASNPPPTAGHFRIQCYQNGEHWIDMEGGQYHDPYYANTYDAAKNMSHNANYGMVRVVSPTGEVLNTFPAGSCGKEC